MFEIIKTPIWLRGQFAKTDTFFYRFKPFRMSRVNGICIKGNKYLVLLTVNDDLKTSIAPYRACYRLSETHLIGSILGPCLLMFPPIF